MCETIDLMPLLFKFTLVTLCLLGWQGVSTLFK